MKTKNTFSYIPVLTDRFLPKQIPTSGYPIRQNIHNQIRVIGIVCFEVNSEVVRTVHTRMHHKNA